MNSADLIALAEELARKVLERSHQPEQLSNDEGFALYDLGYRFAHSTRNFDESIEDDRCRLRREMILRTTEPDFRDFMSGAAFACLLTYEIGLQPRDLFADLVSRIRPDYGPLLRDLSQTAPQELMREFLLLRIVDPDGSVSIIRKPPARS